MCAGGRPAVSVRRGAVQGDGEGERAGGRQDGRGEVPHRHLRAGMQGCQTATANSLETEIAHSMGPVPL